MGVGYFQSWIYRRPTCKYQSMKIVLKYKRLTHKRLFKFLRLHFGTKVAPAVFEQVIDTMLSGLDFAVAYLDDILIKSKTQVEHASHVMEIFQKIKEFDFKLGIEKCEFFLSKIKYLGQITDEKGRRTDPSRVNTIKNMPTPTNLMFLQLFLG